MAKVSHRGHEHNIEKAWTPAKRFHDDRPKGEFKQEGQHFFPKCNDVHWHMMIVNFDKKTMFPVDSCGPFDHKREAKVIPTFFWLALLEKHAATRPSSPRVRPPGFHHHKMLSCLGEISTCWSGSTSVWRHRLVVGRRTLFPAVFSLV
jgi:hypothetical protein